MKNLNLTLIKKLVKAPVKKLVKAVKRLSGKSPTELERILERLNISTSILVDRQSKVENHATTIDSNVKNLGYEYAKSLLKDLKVPGNLLPSKIGLLSKACQQEDIESEWFAYWCQQMKVPVAYHRKMWEFCYILQVLYDYDLLKPRFKGLGFGCGEEPLPSLLAAYDIEITATDLDPQESASKGWLETNQSMASVDKIWISHLCSQELFAKNVNLKYVDMNNIPPDLANKYDFCWSACALEHLGSIKKGLQFIEKSLDTLVPGGVCIHTTELNYLQEEKTIDNEGTVLFRKRDFMELAQRLIDQGHQVAPLNFDIGSGFLDKFIDIPPYQSPLDAHLKLLVGGFATTSFGIIVKKHS